MAFVRGVDVICMVLEALGLQHQNVSRVVIDIAINDVVKIYVNHHAVEEQIDALMGALRGTPAEVTSGTAPIEVSLPNTEVRVTQDGGHPYRLEYRYQDGSEFSGCVYPTLAAAEEAATRASKIDPTVTVYVRSAEKTEK